SLLIVASGAGCRRSVYRGETPRGLRTAPGPARRRSAAMLEWPPHDAAAIARSRLEWSKVRAAPMSSAGASTSHEPAHGNEDDAADTDEQPIIERHVHRHVAHVVELEDV